MGRFHKGITGYALVRLLGFAATVVAVAVLLAVVMGPASGRGLAHLPAVLVGDFGATAAGLSVGALIAERLTVTLPLALFALIAALLAAVPLGALAAWRGGLTARIVAILADGATAIPAFLLGMFGVLLFTGVLRWLPQGGFVPWEQNFGAAFGSLVLPALALAVPLGAMLLREAIRGFGAAHDRPEVVAGRLTGLTERQAVLLHGAPAALLPVLGRAGRSFGLVVAGAMIVENVFYLPGLGRLLLSGAAEHDVAVVQGGLVVLIAIGALVRLLTEVGLTIAEPRRLVELRS